MKPHGEKYFVKQIDDGWLVKCEKPSPAGYLYRNKENAIETGKFLAEENHAELIVQKKDGDIIQKISFN